MNTNTNPKTSSNKNRNIVDWQGVTALPFNYIQHRVGKFVSDVSISNGLQGLSNKWVN